AEAHLHAGGAEPIAHERARERFGVREQPVLPHEHRHLLRARPAAAVAISHATTPPPMMAIRPGTSRIEVASRLVHGCACANPSIGGRTASEPVHTTTPSRAERISSPSPVSTATRRGPASRPRPRTSVTPALFT